MTSVRELRPEDVSRCQELLTRSCDYDDVLGLAGEKVFGPGADGLKSEPVGAFLSERLIGVAASSGRWLRLIAIEPKYRGAGVGSELLKACEVQAAAHGNQLRTLDQPGNYLSPGIDVRNQVVIAWLEKRGYKAVGSACNLLLGLRKNPLISQERGKELSERCAQHGYALLRLPTARIGADAAVVANTFSQGWAFEMRRSHSESDGVHIAIEAATGAFAGFAAHDGNNAGHGWFGPTGVLPGHRGRGLGAALLMACLLDVRKAGHSHCQVAWIGPRDFYEKIVGIDSERHFSVMCKELQ